MYRVIVRSALLNGRRVIQTKKGVAVVVQSRAALGRRLFSSGGYAIHPAIGVARVGNSQSNDWYIEPTEIGGLPKEQNGKPVELFKNKAGEIKRQAAMFTVYDPSGKPLKMADVEDIEWKVWMASKKPIWYEFNVFDGDLMFGEQNSYQSRGTLKRNADYPTQQREKLVINPGPRSVTKDSPKADFDDTLAGSTFPTGALKEVGIGQMSPFVINKLGDMNIMDGEYVSLCVRGGYGKSGGDPSITIKSYGGADKYWDDLSDGPVECHIKLKTGDKIKLNAWVLACSPKYAPELTNICTWDDVILDIGVRFHENFAPLCVDYSNPKEWKYKLGEAGYRVNVERDIQPIFDRMNGYKWVCNIAPMLEFANPRFSLYTNTPENIKKKQNLFRLLREAIDLKGKIGSKGSNSDLAAINPSHQECWNENDYPFQPMQCATGSGGFDAVSTVIDKFMSLSPTQYYCLYQWANGFVQSDEQLKSETALADISLLDRPSVGNCVGYPSCPGIETCWNVRTPNLYEADNPYAIKHYKTIEQLQKDGLDLDRDECASVPDESMRGCEPGDLSKRMACPWQADAANCTAWQINFDDPTHNYTFPQYYFYWWPAQSPFNVYIGKYTADEQSLELDGAVSGQQVLYQRGIPQDERKYEAVMRNWNNFAFIVNESKEPGFANFVEKERNLKAFRDLWESTK